jgi:GTP cyclohydrolase II
MKTPTIEEIIQQDLDSMRNCTHKLDCDNCPEDVCVRLVAMADFPTEYGNFKLAGFINNKDYKDHSMVIKGDVENAENVLTRIHSACLTGEALGSLRCDCGPQLHEALKLIEKEGCGILLYHMEEGRGIGLVNKIRAYVLQDHGYDTMDANTILGFAPDERDYRIPAEMLKKVGVRSIRLMTNNPEKVDQLARYGIAVKTRIQHELPSHKHNQKYLETKKDRFAHLLTLDHEKNEID